MRILYDSKQSQFKSPFGVLTPGQVCTLHIHIPAAVQTTRVECVFTHEDGSPAFQTGLEFQFKKGAYERFGGKFQIAEPGLFFYYFQITTKAGGFRLYKDGDGTNMEAGDCWQLSCIPADFHVPQWAMGATVYQIFPDRFRKAGRCDLTGKLPPYTVHANWDEEVGWQPDAHGHILNNDFFGGNFQGIQEKLDYLSSLGVTLVYLNPIGKSFSNHRYDTGDYKTPDPMLGTMADFSALCAAAHARGIRIILDGVYSHTGADSLYFDKYRHFGGNGASCSPASPYYHWYRFHHWPDSYDAWWGFDTLPTVNKADPDFIEYIITGEDSVLAHWIRAGADGFRLDVADELPPEFLRLLKTRLRELKPDALLMGEVWEDASNKIAYGHRCRYFVDGVLDSVMNYPFRTAIINFLRERDDGSALRNTVLTLAENYPPEVLLCNLNLLGSHDTPRILTALVDDYDGSREEKARRRLPPQQRLLALERLLPASVLQYTLPGCAGIYYGDEAGMEGYQDPFNRRTYPWGQENQALITHFRILGKLRREHPALRLGNIRFIQAGDRKLGFTRSYQGRRVRVCLNCSYDNWELPAGGTMLLGHNLSTVAPTWLSLAPMGFCILEEQDDG